ncbi:hypothetical protein GCM10011369_25020 [Neiella marina]|uniref:DUF4397 domain-containing protein n=1 Tax=Neiella marina TaxID=508461 RepID=A0A8J2U6A7_9GAMM|nr:hypothetical protein [Neiella marina]GGA82027.1 hypothetical protein GCM10011369_25020 [Neiella marina]
MLKNNLYPALALSFATAMLTACGGGGGNNNEKSDDVNETRIQVYNASPNSTGLTYEFEKNNETTHIASFITFGDASGLTQVSKNGTHEVTVSGIDANGDREDILEDVEVNIRNDQRNIVFTYGIYPEIALAEFDFNLNDLFDDTMRFLVADFKVNSPGYDVYVGIADEGFSAAELWATSVPGTMFEVGDFETDTYDIYLTSTGTTDILFTAEDVNMEAETGYIIVLRDTFGPSNSGVAIDKMTSSSTVVSYEDAFGAAQYRFMNLIDQTVNSQIVSGDDTYTQDDIAPYTASPYDVVNYNDYKIFLTDESDEEIYRGVVMSLPQNATMGAAIYHDKEDAVKVLTFPESVRQLTYQVDVNFVNLTTDIDQVDVYFVEEGKTIETTPYTFQSVDFEEVETGNLPTNSYRVNVVIETEDHTLEMVYQSEMFDFQDDFNYTMLLYNDPDTPFGYNVMFAGADASVNTLNQ